MLWLELLAMIGTQLYLYLRPLFGFFTIETYVKTSSYAIYYSIHSAALIGLLVFVMFASGDPLTRFGLVKIRWGRDLLACLALFVGLAIASGISFLAAPELISREQSRTAIHAAPFWLLGVEGALLNAFRELFFRSYLITRLEELLGSTVAAVLFSALACALADWSYGITGVAVTMVFGWILGFAFVRIRSIWPIVSVMTLIQLISLYEYQRH